MTEIEVTVRGTSDTYHRPERATVHMTVSQQGPEKDVVFARTTAATNGLTTLLRSITDPTAGPITWWSSNRLQTWAEKPWNKDGKQLPMVYHAAIGLTAKFRDFDALARFVDELSVMPGVAVSAIEWTVTDALKVTLARDARRRAVLDATERAADYARAAGLTEVTVTAIADIGMLSGNPSFRGEAHAQAAMRASLRAGSENAAPIDLNPEDVEISASVDARFVAR